MPLLDSFVYWTNKGGVGKTTLTYHSSVTYAKANPTEKVILIDLDEQANLSQAVLSHLRFGDEKYKSGMEALSEIRGHEVAPGWSRTLCGLLLAANERGIPDCKREATIDGNTEDLMKHRSFLINPKREGFNSNMPENMYILCGDPRLPSLLTMYQGIISNTNAFVASGPQPAPYVRVMTLIRDFLNEVSNQLGGDVVAFIDTNPSLSIWTCMGICAGKKIVIPVNADDFSTIALRNMFYSLYGMYPFGGTMQQYEETMFHACAKRLFGIPLPKVHAIVHNKSKISKTTSVAAFQALSGYQAELLFTAFEDARLGNNGAQRGDHARIFNLSQLPDPNVMPADKDEFAKAFTGTMRDMSSCGVATIHGGLPLWMLKRFKKVIKEELDGAQVQTGANSSLQDIIGTQVAHNEANQEKNDRCLINLVMKDKIPQERVAHIWTEYAKTPDRKKRPRAAEDGN